MITSERGDVESFNSSEGQIKDDDDRCNLHISFWNDSENWTMWYCEWLLIRRRTLFFSYCQFTPWWKNERKRNKRYNHPYSMRRVLASRTRVSHIMWWRRRIVLLDQTLHRGKKTRCVCSSFLYSILIGAWLILRITQGYRIQWISFSCALLVQKNTEVKLISSPQRFIHLIDDLHAWFLQPNESGETVWEASQFEIYFWIPSSLSAESIERKGETQNCDGREVKSKD